MKATMTICFDYSLYLTYLWNKNIKNILILDWKVAYLWSTNKNFPSKACRETNCICLTLVRVCELAATVEICGRILPMATKQDKLHDSPSPSSCSSKPILAGAHDFKYPVHWITLYLLSRKKGYQKIFIFLLNLIMLPEVCFFLRW